jgi:hypothetical protein
MQKKYFFTTMLISMILQACVSKTNSISLPQPPTSVKAVLDELKGKKYQAEKAGTHSVFENDKEIEWLNPKKEDEFEKKITDEAKTLRLDFVNDTAVTVTAKDKTYSGTYKADDEVKEDEKPGVKHRICYIIDEEFKLGDGPATEVTYTYLVEGISGKNLLLETPRSMNRRKIVVLMSKM